MNNLYAFGLGGSLPGTNIELHDIQFVVAQSPEQAQDIIKLHWYGASLHLDEYKQITGADGHRIELAPAGFTAPAGSMALLFVTMGGYSSEQFGELHEYRLFAAANEQAAKEKAKAVLLPHVAQRHVDTVREVQSCLLYADHTPCTLHLVPDGLSYNFKPDWSGYLPLY